MKLDSTLLRLVCISYIYIYLVNLRSSKQDLMVSNNFCACRWTVTCPGLVIFHIIWCHITHRIHENGTTFTYTFYCSFMVNVGKHRPYMDRPCMTLWAIVFLSKGAQFLVPPSGPEDHKTTSRIGSVSVQWKPEPSFFLCVKGHLLFIYLQTPSTIIYVTFSYTLQGTNISHQKSCLKMIFLFPRWDMLIPWKGIYVSTIFLGAEIRSL